jgi:hypothetical protein
MMRRVMNSPAAKEAACPPASAPASESAKGGGHERELQKRIDQQAHKITSLTLERESLLKLAIGMAVDSYQYSPNEVRSRSVAKIADRLRVAGVPLDEGTILSWLRRGAELLPPED